MARRKPSAADIAYNEQMHEERGIIGFQADLFVAPRSVARGRTHCVRCGGRTTQTNAEGEADHASCDPRRQTPQTKTTKTRAPRKQRAGSVKTIKPRRKV